MAIRNSLPFAMVPKWLLETSVSDKAVRLYAILAVMADNETRRTHPSRKTLAERTHCSLNSIDRALKELVWSGILEVEARRDEHGDPTSNDYILRPGLPTDGGTRLPTDGGTVSPQMRNDLDLPDLDLSGLERRPSPKKSSDGFEAFWKAYPRKIAKGAAQKAYAAAVKRGEPEEVAAGALSFARSVKGSEVRFIPYPATWLNADRWLDEEPLPQPEPSLPDLAERFLDAPGDPDGFAAAATERPWSKGGDAG